MRRRFLKPIEDRFIRGLTGGLIAGIIKDIPDIFLCVLWNIKKLAFWDYVGEMIFNKIPKNFLEHFLAFCIQVSFSLGLGIIFSIIVIPAFPTKHYLVRGVFYGSSCWFVLMSIVKLYHISNLLTQDLLTPMLTLLFSAGYGLLLAYLDRHFSPNKQQSDW